MVVQNRKEYDRKGQNCIEQKEIQKKGKNSMKQKEI